MTPRSDAVRSRERILDAARGAEGEDLGLNEIARRAGVGVGTVYRHFPSVHALTEALTTSTLERLLDVAGGTAGLPAQDAFALLIRTVLDLQLHDGGLQVVLLSPDDEAEDVTRLKEEIFAAFESVLVGARAAGVVRPDLTLEQIEHLVCGIEHAVRLGTIDDAAPFLAVLLAGLRPEH